MRTRSGSSVEFSTVQILKALAFATTKLAQTIDIEMKRNIFILLNPFLSNQRNWLNNPRRRTVLFILLIIACFLCFSCKLKITIFTLTFKSKKNARNFCCLSEVKVSMIISNKIRNLIIYFKKLKNYGLLIENNEYETLMVKGEYFLYVYTYLILVI